MKKDIIYILEQLDKINEKSQRLVFLEQEIKNTKEKIINSGNKASLDNILENCYSDIKKVIPQNPNLKYLIELLHLKKIVNTINI